MTEKHIGRRVVVIGAGIGGLAVAGALADLFDEVVVLERDPLPSNAAPRPGVPQGRHLHGLLGGGLEALCALFPDIECKLSAAGAVPIHINSEFCEEIGGAEKQRRDFGWNGSMQSRPLLEFVIRKALDRHPNVTLHAGCRVLALSSTPDGARVTGVRYPSTGGGTEALEADLVIDASGRGALTTSLLQALDRPRPREIEIGVDLGYATALFAIPADAPKEWLAVLTHADAPHSSRAGVINPVEGNLWMVTLIGRGAEQPPTDLAGFLAFAQSLGTKTIYNAIKSAELIDDISRFVFPASTRRYFDLATLPERLIVMGDALCRFNPMYGQGMSVAACEAVRLRELLRALRGKRNPLAGLGRLFQTEAQAIIEAPWQMSAIPDFIHPDTRGQRPDDFAQTLAYAGALHRLALRDPVIDKLMTEVWHLLQPATVYQEPALIERVKAELAAATKAQTAA